MLLAAVAGWYGHWVWVQWRYMPTDLVRLPDLSDQVKEVVFVNGQHMAVDQWIMNTVDAATMAANPFWRLRKYDGLRLTEKLANTGDGEMMVNLVNQSRRDGAYEQSLVWARRILHECGSASGYSWYLWKDDETLPERVAIMTDADISALEDAADKPTAMSVLKHYYRIKGDAEKSAAYEAKVIPLLESGMAARIPCVQFMPRGKIVFGE